ncbi:MAG: Stf0 family sulfotransferase [Solirubrobacterales bacterium]
MTARETDSHDRLFLEFERAEPRTSYMVCSIPRSGSSLLCELLGSTGLAGAPAEFFHPDKMRALRRRWEVETLDEYLRELLARKTSPNGVFGIKAHLGQYEPLFGDSDPRTVLPDPRLVFITRRDRLRQAVSWVRALQTLRWADHDSPRAERPAVFDHEHITRKLGRIEREEGLWEELFERHGLVPHRVVYEDLVEAQDATVRTVLEGLGIDVPADLHLPPPALDRQADELSDEWVERYLAEASR